MEQPTLSLGDRQCGRVMFAVGPGSHFLSLSLELQKQTVERIRACFLARSLGIELRAPSNLWYEGKPSPQNHGGEMGRKGSSGAMCSDISPRKPKTGYKGEGCLGAPPWSPVVLRFQAPLHRPQDLTSPIPQQ